MNRQHPQKRRQRQRKHPLRRQKLRKQVKRRRRQVEAMDGDLRDALETYLTKCSAVVPYQPFLRMAAESSLPKEDKLHFLNRTINHMEDKEQTKAYHNNAYGLVEYIQSLDAFMADLKAGNGERKKFSATYEQL